MQLEVGVVVPLSPVRWQRRVLERLMACPFVTVTMVDCSPSPARGSAMFHGYAALERAALRRFLGVDDAMESTGVDDLIGTLPVTAQVDLVLQLALPLEPLEQEPRFGVWRYHYDEVPALIDREMVTRQRLTVERAGKPALVAYESTSKLNPASLSLSYNSSRWKSAEFIVRCLADLALDGENYLDGLSPATPEQLADETPPGDRTSLRLLRRLMSNATRRGRELALFDERWFVAFRRKRTGEFPLTDRSGFVPLMPPTDRYYADPFLLERDGRAFLFFENYGYKDRRAVISVVAIDDGQPASEPQDVLDGPDHYSYPFVFEYRGEAFMVPETRSDDCIRLYRATSWPGGWRLEQELMTNVNAVDTTLFEWEGRWWMFTNIAAPNAASGDELWLFYADWPHGPWRCHPRNPVVSDVRTSRSAGRPFSYDGRLYRPGQDSSLRYGHRIVMNRIEQLTTTDYSEHATHVVEPDWAPGIRATHCYDASNSYEALDGQFIATKARRLLGATGSTLRRFVRS